MTKSTSPRSISSIRQPPSPAGVSAPATVMPMVVSLSGSSIFSEKMWHASDSRAPLNAWKPSSISARTS